MSSYNFTGITTVVSSYLLWNFSVRSPGTFSYDSVKIWQNCRCFWQLKNVRSGQILTEYFEKVRKDLADIFYNKQVEILIVGYVNMSVRSFLTFSNDAVKIFENPKNHKENWITVVIKFSNFNIFPHTRVKKCEET